jgi:transposase InsO family protein
MRLTSATCLALASLAAQLSKLVSKEFPAAVIVQDNGKFMAKQGTMEFTIHHERCETRSAARASIFEYIEVFYNRQRLHSTLGYQSPEHFEQAV